jgi:PncC family amidohydrolase
MFEKNLLILVEKISLNFRQRKIKIASAESCTGGLLSALFTSISGSSEFFERGFITYSNQSKIEMLGVKEKTLKDCGAVSKEVVKEMALGALKNSKADIAIAITGIAGPKSDDTKKPVGLVYIAIAEKEIALVNEFNFSGSRDEIRIKTIISAIEILTQLK